MMKTDEKDQVLSLGVLDLGTVHPGTTPGDALWATIDLAPRVEAFGYSRYWLAEHHTSLASHASPETLVPVLAGITEKIRIGTAGVLLNLYSPFKVASTFRLLEILFPDRIDLGVARATPPDPELARLFLQGQQATPFDQKVRDLRRFLHGSDSTTAFRVPAEVWLLGKETTTMRLAAEIGTAFCLGLFIGNRVAEACRYLDQYRKRFVPSPHLSAPRTCVAFAGVCADTERRARRIAASYGPAITPSIIGDPDQFRAGLVDLRKHFGTNRFIFLDLCKRLEDKIRSLELVARAAGLSAAYDGGV